MRDFLIRRWLMIFIIGFGVFNILPFVAPVLMYTGWESGGNLIYTAYGPFCHQMAQRSFFLFGDKLMLNANELPVSLTGQTNIDTLTLRAFRGSEAFGWKVAWSDRMVYLYGSFWLGSIIYYLQSRRKMIQPISFLFFMLAMVPIGLDGGTHFLSDFSGLTAGFRYTNDWLAALTGNALPTSFYAGDAIGSFNSIMRLVSGVTFGLGMAYYVLPMIGNRVNELQAYLTYKQEAYAKLRRQYLREDTE